MIPAPLTLIVPKISVLPVAVSTWNVTAGVAAPLVIVKYSEAGLILPLSVIPFWNETPPTTISPPVKFKVPPTYKSPCTLAPPATCRSPVVFELAAVPPNSFKLPTDTSAQRPCVV